MLKTYQFKTQCKGDIHSSKTANIILPGLVTEYRRTPIVFKIVLKFKWSMDAGWNNLCHRVWIVLRMNYESHVSAFTYILSRVLAKYLQF